MDLFPHAPRRPRITRMRVTDAGDNCCGLEPGAFLACFKCHRCGHEEMWVKMQTVSEAKRGLPCPKCNEPHAGQEGAK